MKSLNEQSIEIWRRNSVFVSKLIYFLIVSGIFYNLLFCLVQYVSFIMKAIVERIYIILVFGFNLNDFTIHFENKIPLLSNYFYAGSHVFCYSLHYIKRSLICWSLLKNFFWGFIWLSTYSQYIINLQSII